MTAGKGSRKLHPLPILLGYFTLAQLTEFLDDSMDCRLWCLKTHVTISQTWNWVVSLVHQVWDLGVEDGNQRA